jgi:hypothetical protein
VACLAFINLIFIDPCIVGDSVEIPTRCSFVIEFIIPKFIEGFVLLLVKLQSDITQYDMHRASLLLFTVTNYRVTLRNTTCTVRLY